MRPNPVLLLRRARLFSSQANERAAVPPAGTSYALELGRQLGSKGFEYLRGNGSLRLTFSLDDSARWKKVGGNSSLAQRKLDEFHLNVCAEAWRSFGPELFPKTCDEYWQACAGMRYQRYPTCECALWLPSNNSRLQQP